MIWEFSCEFDYEWLILIRNDEGADTRSFIVDMFKQVSNTDFVNLFYSKAAQMHRDFQTEQV